MLRVVVIIVIVITNKHPAIRQNLTTFRTVQHRVLFALLSNLMQSLRLFRPFQTSLKLQFSPTARLQRSALSTTAPAMAKEFKLKDVTSLGLKNGEKKEVEVEGVEGGKVLLLKVQDQVHATSANCTHYGAPLSKGVLTPEGRITCPWHGGESAWSSGLNPADIV